MLKAMQDKYYWIIIIATNTRIYMAGVLWGVT